MGLSRAGGRAEQLSRGVHRFEVIDHAAGKEEAVQRALAG
jgi:hypothetical protein